MNKTPVICLMGPTAAGKSAATLAIAQRWPVEIVNVDSATIYRGMDIGTAKPGPDERRIAPQHLLDIFDPSEAYSAARFRQDALHHIRSILARGRLPVLAGGTMLYFKALREGLSDLPAADPKLRATLEARAAELGWPALHAELREKDPATAQRLAPNDSQRIQRALEICLLSGKPMSELIGDHAQVDDIADLAFIEISLEPDDRSGLHQRIAQRFDAMLDAGLVDEVNALYIREDLHAGLPAIRCVGYRQIWRHLAGETPLPMAREQGIAATRQLAKRQLTWLRGRPSRVIVNCLARDPASQVVDIVARLGSRADSSA